MRLLKMAAAVGLMAGSFGLTTIANADQAPNRDIRIESEADFNRHVLGIPDGRTPDWNKLDNRRDDRRDRDRRYDRSDRRDRDSRYYQNNWQNNRRDREWREVRGNSRNYRECKNVWRDNRKVRVCR